MKKRHIYCLSSHGFLVYDLEDILPVIDPSKGNKFSL